MEQIKSNGELSNNLANQVKISDNALLWLWIWKPSSGNLRTDTLNANIATIFEFYLHDDANFFFLIGNDDVTVDI